MRVTTQQPAKPNRPEGTPPTFGLIPGRRAISAAAGGVLAMASSSLAQGPVNGGNDALMQAIDPMAASAFAGICIAIAAVAYAMRVATTSQTRSINWSSKLAEIETQLEKADAVLSAQPGLVLVWEDDYEAIETGWGEPRFFGGPAALASLMSFAEEGAAVSPVARLLDTLGALPVDDESGDEDIKSLKAKIHDLRAHGVAFSGAVITAEGRAIETAGRVAGGQVALWLTDPAARMAEDSGFLGKVQEKTADLHGALNFLERTGLPAWRRHADLSLIWVNKAYAGAVEAASPATVLKDQIELDPAIRKIAERAAEDKTTVEGRVIVNMHGERRVLKVTETPMHTVGGAALGGYCIDITELEKTKEDLRQHIEANRRTLDQIPTAVALFGGEQELLYYNSAFLKLWMLEDGALINRPTHGEFLDQLRHAGKLPEQADYAAWKKQQLCLYTDDLSAPGSERHGAAPDEVWNLPDGRALRVARARHPFGGVLIIFDDITENMELERRFNTQINVQHATLDNLSEAVAVFNADGALRLFNKAFRDLWRLDDDVLAAAPHIDKIIKLIDGLAEDDRGLLDDVRRRVTSMSPADRQSIEDGELSLGDARTFSFGTQPLPDGATLVYFMDITDSREREKELKERNALLEDIDRQKSKFVDHVSYQLRTPLATIIGFAEMLDGQMFGVLNDRQEDYVASILSASHHLRDLITDIIDLAVIDAGKMTIDLSEVDIRDLLENAATYAALKAEDTQVSLKVECDRKIGRIQADEKRLKQVLFNLLSNAFAYTHTGGEVTIGADRAPGLIRLWVQDSGRGVSPDDQPKAFDPFVSSGPSAGAGIGLALVKRFIDLHGGWVRMESMPDKGTRVTCFIPARIVAQEPDGTGHDETDAIKGPTGAGDDALDASPLAAIEAAE